MKRARSTPRARTALYLAVAAGALVPLGAASAGTPLGATAVPKTLRVPEEFLTIQAAVDASGNGDTVQVRAGFYAEQVVVPSGRIGLKLSGAPAATIDAGSGAPAIRVVGGKDILVTGFTLVSGTDALRFESTFGTTVRQVQVMNAGGDGIVGVELNGRVVVEGSRVRHAGGTGIRIELDSVDRAELSITGNTVDAAGVDGIFAFSEDDRGTIHVADNHVSNTQAFGIRTDCGYADVVSNEVSGTGFDGISVHRTRSECHVASNVVSDAGWSGIAIDETPSSLVTGNVVSGAERDGINVAGPAVFIRENKISDVGLAGVRTLEVEAHFQSPGTYGSESIGENVIERTGADGIVVSQGIGITVDANRVDDAGGTAILVSGSELLVTDNAIERPAVDGVFVENLGGQGGVRVDGNRVVQAGEDGVDLGGTGGVVVVRNTVDVSGDCGFRLGDGAAGNRFKKNVASGCGSFGLMESDAAGKNRFEKSNRFGRSHRRARHR